jgi:c-di-GMP-binding flagellar brake protein YcgR
LWIIITHRDLTSPAFSPILRLIHLLKGGSMDSLAVQTVQDKRKHARLDIALSVSYAVKHNGDPSEMAEAMSTDISAGGLRLMTPSPLNPGDVLDMEIVLTGEHDEPRHIKASGEVVWQNKVADKSFETGAVIKHIDDKDKQYLMSFVFDQISKMVGGRTTEILH